MEYFAKLSIDEIGSYLDEKVKDYFNYLQSSGRFEMYYELYKYYYAGYFSRGSVLRGGKQGELLKANINEFKNLLQHIRSLISADRPVWDCRAVNTDYDSLAQSKLGNSILDYYIRNGNFEDNITKSLIYALLFGEGWNFQKWENEIGREVMPDLKNNKIIHEGDVSSRTYMPMDVIRDYSRYDNNHDWIILRDWINRYDLSAKYPDKKDDIMSVSRQDLCNVFNRMDSTFKKNDDLIEVYTFIHKKNNILPEGRIIQFCNASCILTDDKMFYKDFPVYCVMAEHQADTAFGYSVSFDLLPIQKMMDACDSTMISNINAFGKINVLVPKGCNIDTQEIADGLSFLYYDENAGAPQTLDLLKISGDVMNYRQNLSVQAETISGVNSVARGNPEAGLKNTSGSALALIQSMAVQFSTSLQQSYIKFLEWCGLSIIQNIQTFSNSKRIISIVGKTQKQYINEFSKDDISDINKVYVDIGNPASRQLSGKLQTADTLLQYGLIKTAEQYINIRNTGNLDVVEENPISELMNIKLENEEIMEGIIPNVLMTDRHDIHIREHKVNDNSPKARKNPKVMNASTVHRQMHEDALRTMDPMLAGIIGIQSLPPTNIQQTQNSNVQNENLPNMPVNPLTGEETNINEGVI